MQCFSREISGEKNLIDVSFFPSSHWIPTSLRNKGPVPFFSFPAHLSDSRPDPLLWFSQLLTGQCQHQRKRQAGWDADIGGWRSPCWSPRSRGTCPRSWGSSAAGLHCWSCRCWSGPGSSWCPHPALQDPARYFSLTSTPTQAPAQPLATAPESTLQHHLPKETHSNVSSRKWRRKQNIKEWLCSGGFRCLTCWYPGLLHPSPVTQTIPSGSPHTKLQTPWASVT